MAVSVFAHSLPWRPSEELGPPLLRGGQHAAPFPGDAASPGCGRLGLCLEKVAGGGLSTPLVLQRQ